MQDAHCSTPVVFLIFNRPDTTERVFEMIRQARPPKLLVVADGPRADKQGDASLCSEARAVIRRVDWPCEVMTNYTEVNLGCKKRVSSGLDWAFEQVEEAIILEDDCLPHPDFFRFCEIMLDRYRHDTRVMMVCGTNYLINIPDLPESYFFANYYPIWGWATWRRAWNMYDVEMQTWDSYRDKDQLSWLFGRKEIASYYTAMFDLIRKGFDTWDIQWWFACIFQHGLAIIPRSNLISNLGESGTHVSTQRNLFINMSTHSIGVDAIRHPAYVTPDIILNRLTYERSHANLTLSLRTALKNRDWKRILMRLLPCGTMRAYAAVKSRLKNTDSAT